MRNKFKRVAVHRMPAGDSAWQREFNGVTCLGAAMQWGFVKGELSGLRHAPGTKHVLRHAPGTWHTQGIYTCYSFSTYLGQGYSLIQSSSVQFWGRAIQSYSHQHIFGAGLFPRTVLITDLWLSHSVSRSKGYTFEELYLMSRWVKLSNQIFDKP